MEKRNRETKKGSERDSMRKQQEKQRDILKLLVATELLYSFILFLILLPNFSSLECPSGKILKEIVFKVLPETLRAVLRFKYGLYTTHSKTPNM